MRIVSCHITGYGKFNNYDIDFSEGLNIINEDNGWGKSTLCSFITAMFYGIPGNITPKKFTEKKQFKPWDKSVYGGNLTFKVDGKTYRVERFFESKEKDDTFALYDVDTNLESGDYSKALGEELFGIDRDSFAKSIFIMQNRVKPAMTDAINGKLGDLVTVQDDINNFDVAIKRIEKEIKVYTLNGKDETRGLSLKLKDEINELKEEADRLESYEESKVMNEKLLVEKQKKREEIEAEKEDLRKRIKKQSERDQLTGEYNSVLKSYEEEKKNLDELDDFFALGVPSDEEMKEYFELSKEADVLQSRCDDIQKKMPEQDKVDELKKLFDEPLSEETIDDWMERANRLSELRIQKEHAQLSDEDKDSLQELKYYFAKKKPTKEELDIVRIEAENVNRLQGRIEETRGYYEQQKHIYEETQKEGNSDKKSTFAMLLIVASVILLGSIVSIILVESTIGIITGIAGIIISLVIYFVAINNHRRRSISSKNLIEELRQSYEDAKEKYEQVKSEYDTSEKICREFLSDFLVNANDTMQQMISDIEIKAEKYDALLDSEEKAVEVGGNAIEELTSLEMSLYTELLHYQNAYGAEDLYSTNAEIELIQRIKEDNKIYIEYFADDKERSQIIEQRETNLKKIAVYLNRFPVVEGDNIAQKIAYINAKKGQYDDIEPKVKKHKEFIERFEKENEDYKETESIEELQNRQAEMDDMLRTLGEEINQTHVQIRDVRENIDNCQECIARIDELREKIAEYDAKVDYLEKTSEYLTKAKDNFLSTYMRPLQKGMRSYLKRIDGGKGAIDSEAFRIDTKLSVSVTHEGSSKQESYLSAGYRDLAFFCARLALIDIMYEGQQPMIILDDPFTNFDGDKIDMALELIEELSKEKQILYFTCHASRSK